MTHDETRESLGAYALFALSDEERELVEVHLATCEACREEVEQLLSVQGQMGLLAIERDPPPELRTRLLNLVELDRAQWEREQPKGAATATASGRGTVAGWWQRLIGRLARLPRLAYGVGGVVLAAVIVLVVILANRNGVAVEHTYACTVAKPSASGVKFSGTSCSLEVRSDHTTRVAFTDLPTLPASKAYELWVIPGTGNPVPVGGFVAHGDGSFTGQYPVDASKYPLAAVTIEKAPGNSPAPRGPIVLTVSLKG